jgi:hypothetical protein
MQPNKQSFLYPDRYLATTNKHWQVWRSHNGIRSLSGEFTTRLEAEQALKQLTRLEGSFTLIYTGKYLTGEDNHWG